MKADDPYPNPPIIVMDGTMYYGGASKQAEPPAPPKATIPCALIGGSILVVLAIVCLLAGVGMDWLRAVAQ